jgi:hypothetical protein
MYIADGHSTSGFSTAWATAVRTDSTVLLSPFNDRATTVNPRNPPASVFFETEAKDLSHLLIKQKRMSS